MSDLGAPPAPEDPGQPAGGPSSNIPLSVVVGAVTVMLVLVGLLVVVVTQMHPPGSYPERAQAAISTPSYPQKWDRRIRPYARIAERLRGLDFQHPVAVRFLQAGRFEKTVTSDAKELKKDDRREIEQFTGLMRAFGLLDGDVDLFAATNDFSGGSTLAYYSFDDKSITIRGHTLTPAVRSTLVHELTHALQDQHFDVGDRMTKLHKESEGGGASTSEASVLDAVIEGDAERVQRLYRDSLTTTQRETLDAGQQSEVTQASKKIAKVPRVIVTLMTSSYTLGEALVQTVAADGGNTGVDELFRDPPTHESSLLDPFEVLSGDTDAAHVDVPDLHEGEKKFDSGEFGVLTWYLMLAERLPLKDALAAADGWGGDAYVAFDRNGTSCARMTYAGKTPRDGTHMFAALQRWVAAAPGSSATVSREGRLLRFESCDPGEAAGVGKDASPDAVGLVTVRTYTGIGLMRSGAPDDMARCMAGRLVRAFPVSKLVDPTFGAGDRAVQARVRQVTAPCR